MPITENEWRTDIRLNGFSKRIVHGYQLKHFVKILVFVSTDPAFHSRCSVQRPPKINWSSCPQSTVSRISSSAVCRCRVSRGTNERKWSRKILRSELLWRLENSSFTRHEHNSFAAEVRILAYRCEPRENCGDFSRSQTSFANLDQGQTACLIILPRWLTRGDQLPLR